MTNWLQRIQKRIDTNAKFFLWFGCLISMARNTLKRFFSKSEKKEEMVPPRDYVVPLRHIWDWERKKDDA
jgi:hypothetical protein